jgi:hypothetical protein
MELRTRAVDRLIESIAPSLAAELERVAEEVRQQLEAEFHEKIQSALRDAELETLHLAEVRLEEAVLRTREEVRIQLTEEFDAQLHIAIEQVRNEMRLKADEAMQAAFANWTAERAELQEQLSLWHVYAEAQRTLSECTSQPEILSQLLKLSEPFADSLAIYISKADGLALWRHRGDGVFTEMIAAVDSELYFKPAVVRDKTVAAICAIRPCRSEALDFLMSCFERAIESFGLKLQKPANV